MRIDEMFSGDLVNSLDSSIDSELNELEMMGYDIEDPEVMQGLFSKIVSGIRARRSGRGGGSRGGIIKRIISRIKRRKRAKRKKKKSGYGLSFMSPEGTAMLTPEGISFEQKQKMIAAGLLPPDTKPGAGGIMDQITKNPMLLAIPAGLLLMIMMKGKTRQVVIAK